MELSVGPDCVMNFEMSLELNAAEKAMRFGLYVHEELKGTGIL